MIEARRRFLAIGWATIITVVAGCDSSQPGVATTRISVPADRTMTVEERFETADGWATIDGTWTAEKSGERTLLKQTATDQTFPVTLLRQPEFTDVDVTVEFRPVSGKIDASGGIVFRAQDGSNYYVVRANSLEDNYRLYATVAGSRNQIAGTKIDVPDIGKWHTLRVVAVGDHIQAYLNGELLIDHHDSRFKSGRVGLWTKADAVTEFARFSVTGTIEKTNEQNVPASKTLTKDVATLQDKAPDQAHAMADVDYHFSNLWFAAHAKNWPLADFYWKETLSHMKWAVRIIPVRKDKAGQEIKLQEILQSIENSPFMQVGKTIEAKDLQEFEKAYRFTLEGCYSCHKAADKPYLRPQIPERPASSIINFDPNADWPK